MGAFPFFGGVSFRPHPDQDSLQLEAAAPLQLDGALPPARLNRTALTKASDQCPIGFFFLDDAKWRLDALRMASLASSPLPMTRIGRSSIS
jgi:hypothetical protein